MTEVGFVFVPKAAHWLHGDRDVSGLTRVEGVRLRDCKTYPVNQLGTYRYVVVISWYQGKLLLSRHQDRSTWETQGGHIETGETPLQAAERELVEESGATEFTITPAFDYWASDDSSWANGMVFVAEIQQLGSLPDSEIAEVGVFEALPLQLTYPWITPVLIEQARILGLKGAGC